MLLASGEAAITRTCATFSGLISMLWQPTISSAPTAIAPTHRRSLRGRFVRTGHTSIRSADAEGKEITRSILPACRAFSYPQELPKIRAERAKMCCILTLSLPAPEDQSIRLRRDPLLRLL